MILEIPAWRYSQVAAMSSRLGAGGIMTVTARDMMEAVGCVAEAVTSCMDGCEVQALLRGLKTRAVGLLLLPIVSGQMVHCSTLRN